VAAAAVPALAARVGVAGAATRAPPAAPGCPRPERPGSPRPHLACAGVTGNDAHAPAHAWAAGPQGRAGLREVRGRRRTLAALIPLHDGDGQRSRFTGRRPNPTEPTQQERTLSPLSLDTHSCCPPLPLGADDPGAAAGGQERPARMLALAAGDGGEDTGINYY